MTPPGVAGVVRAVGRRNVLYLLFTLALVPLAAALDAAGSRGGPGTLGTVLLWAAVSVPFVPVNAALLVRDLLRGRKDGRPLRALLGCALPFAVAATASG